MGMFLGERRVALDAYCKWMLDPLIIRPGHPPFGEALIKCTNVGTGYRVVLGSGKDQHLFTWRHLLFPGRVDVNVQSAMGKVPCHAARLASCREPLLL